MSSPAQRTQPQSEDQVTAAILVVLLSGLPLQATEAHVIPLLERLGIGPQAAFDAVHLIVPQIEAESRTPLLAQAPKIERHPETGALHVGPPVARTPAQSHVRTTEVPRHSRYLVAAAKRFQAAQTQAEGQVVMQRERGYLAQHLNAVRLAREAAKRVDAAVARYGSTELGWWAHLDSRTTRECRAAHGANFSALRPPLIGYPGTLHGGTCRCHAGPAHKTTLTVDEATRSLRDYAVLPFVTELSES